jgi:putative RNA 2'-phosphotransferase
LVSNLLTNLVGVESNPDELDEIVATNPKQRFAFSEDRRRIRANQGHSTEVELGHEPAEPPDLLFYGTIRGLLLGIREKGLLRMERHHVHLSADETTALAVGGRRGKPVILRIDARAMRKAGHVFFRTPNGVWLTDTVPNSFISGFDDE